MINFKVVIDSAGNTDRKTLGTIKQYSVNAYDIYFYIPAEWEGYSFTSSIKRNDGTAITALLPLTTGLDNEGNYVLLNLTEWISDYKGEVKIQIFATYNGKTYSSSIVKLIVEEGVMPSDWSPSDVPNPYQAVLDYVNTQLALKVNKTFTIRTGTSSGNTFAMTGTEILLTTNFTPYASIANIVAGETIEVMMSKISKWFSSFADVVFTGDYSDLANLPDLGALAYLDSITSEYLPSGIVIDSSYVHTDNNFTSNLKTRLEGIEEGAQVNIIEGVSVNSTPLTPATKVVNIVVPTKTSNLTNDSNFVATSDINKLIKSMALSQVETTGVITITWTCYDNTTGSTSIDLAIEQIIDPDTTYYNSETKSLVLGFVGGGSVIIPIGDLVDLYYADEETLTQYLDVDSKYKFKIKDSWISANIDTKLDKTGDSLNNVVTFTIAATRENINTGESHATLFGKIKKWFGDLKALAFKDAVTSAEMPSDTVFDSLYVHTDNNFTSNLKTRLEGIEEGAQVNIIEGVSVNSTPLTPATKVVNIVVPTKTSNLTNDSNFVATSDINKLIKSMELSQVESTGVITITWTCYDNTTGSTSIDLAIEQIIDPDTTYYNSETKSLVLGFVGGGSVIIPIDDLVDLALKVNKTFAIRTGTSSGNTFAMTGTEILLTTNFTPYASIANIVAGETIEVMMSKISKWFSSFADVVFTGDYSDLTNLPDLKALAFKDVVTSAEMPSDTVFDSLYVHTDNNFTSNLKTRLEGIEAGAQVNTIEEVDVNGTPLTVVSKKVNVSVPTKTSDLNNDSNFVATSDIAALITDVIPTYSATTGIVTFTFNFKDGSTAQRTLDLPIEFVTDIENTYYDSVNKKLVFGFAGGTSIEIPIGDLVDLYFADEITLTQYLDSEDSKWKFKLKDSWISANIDTKLNKNGDSKDNTVSFAEADSRTNIATGEAHSTLFGKIKKWFGDLKALAFKDAVTSAEMPSDTVFDSNYVHTDNNLTDSIISDITSNTSSRHTHTNKTLLDGFTGLRTTIRASASASDTELVSEKATSTELELKEVLANKINAIRDSETATNVKYPSELAVRTLFDTGLIYAEDLIAINYPTDEQIAGNPTYYQGVLPSVYMVLSWFNDKLAAAGYGDMVKSVFATNAKVAQGYVDKAIMADSATSADDSVLLGGQLPSYYLNYNNLTNTPSEYADMFKSVFATNAKVAQGYVDKAIMADSATSADDSVLLGGQLPSYYLNYNNLTNTPDYGDMFKSTFATNAKVAQGYVDKAIMADSATTADDSAELGGQLPSYYLNYNNLTNTPASLKNPYSLTFGTQTYDGSSAKTITKSDLGLSNVINPTTYGGIAISEDFDAITFGGLYTGFGTATGAPNTSYSWFLFHQNSNAGTVSASQIAIAYSSTRPLIYSRIKMTNWGSWKKLLTTDDIDSAITNGSTKAIRSGAVYTALLNKLNTSLKGAINGLAELDSSGKVPTSQLPSYVDDVLEYASLINFPATGESGKIYVALDTNKTYRWSGSSYTEISKSLALGETSSTAYRGDKGKTAYDHSQIIDGSNPHNTTFANIASKPTTLSGYGITDALALGETSATAYRGDKGKTAYDHSQINDGSNPHNTTFANIASKPTTLSGYGITDALALGETSATAYRGDKGKTAYDHSQINDGSNPHNTTFANIASKPTTLSGYGITDALSGNKILTFSKSVLTTDFVSDATYEDYGYKATINCSGVTTDYSAQVNLSAAESIGGTFAPFTDTGNGVVYIYSTEVPNTTISVNIIATKVV